MSNEYQNDTPAQYWLEHYRIEVTFFQSFAAKWKEQKSLTLLDLAIDIGHESRKEKRLLPWLKLAVFGDVKTPKGSLRHDANVLYISGVEVEHDAGKMSFDEAVDILRTSEIRCLVYTSPSHSKALEKWRVLAPTSQSLPPAERYKLAARLNGLLRGVCTAESFTLSQSYYYGAVDHNPEHRVEVIDGADFIDLCDDLNAGAIGAPEKVKAAKPQAEPSESPGYTDAQLDELIATANDVDRNGDRQWHTNMRAVTASLVMKFKSDTEIHRRCAPAARDGFGDEDVQTLIDGARDKWGIADPEVSDAEFTAALADFAAEAKAEGFEGPGFRVKERDRLPLSDFCSFLPTHQYIFRPTGEMWVRGGVNAALGKVRVGEKEIPASVWLDHHAPISQMTWAPGQPQIIKGEITIEGGFDEHKGTAIFNMYHPPIRKPGEASGAVKWMQLIGDVYPNHLWHIVGYMAHRIQRPGEKINHALVLTGSPGIGKDTMLEPLRYGVGFWNFKEVSPQNIADKNNDYMKSVVLRISEAHDLGDTDRFKLYETMKTITAAPPDVVRVNIKYVPEHYVVNVTSTIITTNYASDGLYLPPNDRRHYVCGTEAHKDDFDPDYWTEIWKWYLGGGVWDVVAYLERYDLAKFDAKQPPKKTEAFWRMADGGMASEVPELRDALDKLGQPQVDGSIVLPSAVTLDMIIAACSNDSDGLYEWLRNRINRRAIPHRMETCGYVPVRNPFRADGAWVVGKKRKVIYGLLSADIPTRVAAAEALCRVKTV